jgi:hypothetical protein
MFTYVFLFYGPLSPADLYLLAQADGARKDGGRAKPRAGQGTARDRPKAAAAGGRGEGGAGARLPHLARLPAGRWPSVAVQLGASVPGLLRQERVKRLHLLADHLLRVLGHLPGGQDVALERVGERSRTPGRPRRGVRARWRGDGAGRGVGGGGRRTEAGLAGRQAVKKEREVFAECLRKGLPETAYKARLATLIRKVRPAARRAPPAPPPPAPAAPAPAARRRAAPGCPSAAAPARLSSAGRARGGAGAG